MPRLWPEMGLLGLVFVLLLTVPGQLVMGRSGTVQAGLFWVAVFFAGTLAVDRSFASEREGGCWQALQLYPIGPTALFVAKLLVNFASLAVLQAVLVPVFVALAELPLLRFPARFLLVAGLANLGYAALGTLLSALTNLVRRRGNLFVLLLLPLLVPIVLASAGATESMVAGRLDEAFWHWVQLLAAFAIVFTVVGMLVFEFVYEE